LPLEQIHCVITDESIRAEDKKALEKSHLDVVIV
jgi:DeoR/GlpR family transcriptional regulator of sugar metabolism